jgi:hypothetical protein
MRLKPLLLVTGTLACFAIPHTAHAAPLVSAVVAAKPASGDVMHVTYRGHRSYCHYPRHYGYIPYNHGWRGYYQPRRYYQPYHFNHGHYYRRHSFGSLDWWMANNWFSRPR